MSFTDAQKTDIRRFCGYPAFGGTPSSFQSYRFFQAYGAMEFKLNNLSSVEEAVVTTTYLPNLALLETDIVGSRVNLDTESASVWKHNKREIADRESLFYSWRLKLCQFLGVASGPALETSNRVIV